MKNATPAHAGPRQHAPSASHDVELTLGVLDLVVDGVVLVDAAGRVQFLNAAARQIFGSGARTTIGRSIRALLPSMGESATTAATEHRTTRGELLGMMWPASGRHADGSVIDLNVRYRWFELDGDRLLAYLVREADAPEPAQRVPDAALEDEPTLSGGVSLRAVADLSHELRTPLNAIIGYAEMLSEDMAEEDADLWLDDVGRIRRSARHLVRLVDTMLDLSRIEAGAVPLRREPVDVATLVETVFDAVRPLATRRGNNLRVEVEPTVARLALDADKMRQTLINLVANACKFTSDGEVSVHVAPRGERAAFEVRDTGIGMTREQLHKVFDPFIQASEETRERYGGTGLGLTICERLTRLMGGELEVESEQGRGTRFTVHLPHDGAQRAAK